MNEHDIEAIRLNNAQKIQFWDGLFGVVRTAFRVLGWVVVAWFGYRTISAAAGTTTQGVIKIDVSRGLAYTISAVTTLLWGFERRDKRKTVSKLSEHINELEKRADPGRSSSGLSRSGRPRRGERDAI